MGWTYPYSTPTKRELRDQLVRDLQGETWVTLIDHATAGGDSRLWWVGEFKALPDMRRPELAGKRFIGLYLIANEGGKGAGYKDMDESVEPYYYDCPLRLLKAAEPAADAPGDHGPKWREAVRQWHAAQAAKRKGKVAIAPGMVVTVDGQEARYQVLDKSIKRGQWRLARLPDGAIFRAAAARFTIIEDDTEAA